MEVLASPIAGCVELRPGVRADARGSFVKAFHAGAFADAGLPGSPPDGWRELYHTRSHAGVVRGLHFQTPPHDHHKLVSCLWGDVHDVVVDLRVGSPTYGAHATFRLSAAAGNSVVVPPGLAHGFAALEESVLLYAVTSAHAPDHDAGVRWDSAGVDWPVTAPTVSARDAALPPLAGYPSPFRWSATVARS